MVELTSLREKLIKIGAKVVSHGMLFKRSSWPRSRMAHFQVFAEILSLNRPTARTACAGITGNGSKLQAVLAYRRTL